MMIDSIELPDPKDFTIDDVTGTTEEVLLSGGRRYLKFGVIKKDIRLFFLGINDSVKNSIENLASTAGTLSIPDGKLFATPIQVRDERMKNQLSSVTGVKEI